MHICSYYSVFLSSVIGHVLLVYAKCNFASVLMVDNFASVLMVDYGITNFQQVFLIGSSIK